MELVKANATQRAGAWGSKCVIEIQGWQICVQWERLGYIPLPSKIWSLLWDSSLTCNLYRRWAFISQAFGRFSILIPVKDWGFFFLWSEDEPNLRRRDQQSRLLVGAVQDQSVKYMVPILYGYLKIPSRVVHNRYRKFSVQWDLELTQICKWNAVDVGTESAEQMIVVQDYL